MSKRPTLASCLFAATIFTSAVFAHGQQLVNHADFSSTADITCNGSALINSCRTNGTALELTQDQGSQAGSAWFVNPAQGSGGMVPLANGFTTNFQFRFTASSTPADGLAFVIQKSGTTALADGGGQIGYGNGTKVQSSENPTETANSFPSVAVEFDTYLNDSDNGDPYVPHVAVQACAAPASNTADHLFNNSTCNFGISTSGAVPYLSDGNVHTATINYVIPTNCSDNCTPTLSVIIDQNTVLTTSINIPNQLGLDSSGDAFVGFTSATGFFSEAHDILNWNFSVTSTQTAPVSQQAPVVVATFNSAPNQQVTQTVDFTGAFQTPTGNEPSNPVLTASNHAIAPGDWPAFVAGTPFATTTCIPHNGEGGNCKLYTDLCTNDGSSTPAGINCPQSSSTNIIIQDTFDATPKPATPVGTGFGFLMGGDNWSNSAASCILEGNLLGVSCPQDILTSFTGDGSTGTGKTKSLNSTFISVAGVLMPQTFFTTSATGSNGWVTSPTPSLSFTSYPPGIDAPAHGTVIPLNGSNLPVNGYVAAPVSSIAYNVNGAAIPPAALVNSQPCFGTPTTPGGPVPLNTPIQFTPTPVAVALGQGVNTIQYSATDCAGISELLFSFDTPTLTWSTATKAASVYVDSVKPMASCPAADSLWHNSNVVISCTATDNASGFPPVTNTVGATNFGATSELIPLTAIANPGLESSTVSTGSATVTDLAGNGPVTVGPVTGIKIDTKAPTITPVTNVNGTPTYFLNQAVSVTYKCADAGSGVAKCGTTTFSPSVHATNNLVSTLTTTALGQGKTFSISANDLAGNVTTTNLFNYNVSYLFIGFLTLQQPPLMNTFKAGKAMAILFDVQDGKIKAVSGLKLAPAGAVTTSAFTSPNCNGSSPVTVPFSPTLVGLPLGAYSLNWTPPSNLAGKCVTVNVGLGDGVTHKVNLKF